MRGVRKVGKFGSKRRSRAGVLKSFWDTFCASKGEIFGMNISQPSDGTGL